MNSSKNSPLAHCLDALPPASAYWVAYSGGVDSHVLLHLLAARRDRLGAPLGAVHVNHRIQPQSNAWEQHCRATCDALGVRFQCLQVDGKPRPGESPEAAARAARYRALAAWLPAGALVLSAQHQDDQAETLLLQLLRGAGPRGLAAMPRAAPLGSGRLLRPLLPVTRNEIMDYARQQGLEWVEDPSNSDLRYHRNRLRHRVMPELEKHWPGASAVLARAAANQADQREIAETLAASDYAQCLCPDRTGLSVPALGRLGAPRQRNLLRYWIERMELPLPARAVLERVRREMIETRVDARPLVHWPGAEMRRYRDALHLMTPLPAHDPSRRLEVQLQDGFALRIAGGVLTATLRPGEGLRVPGGARVEVGFRRGGERLRPAGRAHHHALKKLFQEWRIPDWERERVPLLYVDDQLACVAGLCVDEDFVARDAAPGYLLRWSRSASFGHGKGAR